MPCWQNATPQTTKEHRTRQAAYFASHSDTLALHRSPNTMLPSSHVQGRRRPEPFLLQPSMILASTATAEFMGTLLLQLFAGSTTSPARAAAAYGGLSASFARHSGGHLNPALSLAAALSGHLTWFTTLVYIVAQILGALAGAAIQVMITPGLHFGQSFAPSCHAPITGMGGTPLYLWETLAAFVFVYVAYPAIFARPGYGSLAPLMLGVTLFGVVSTAGPYTGYSLLNPALSFASSWVFNCAWRWSWMYWLAQLTGAGVAALLGVGVFGMGPGYLPEEDRAHYTSLPGDVISVRDSGLAGELSPTAAAPAGTF